MLKHFVKTLYETFRALVYQDFKVPIAWIYEPGSAYINVGKIHYGRYNYNIKKLRDKITDNELQNEQ